MSFRGDLEAQRERAEGLEDELREREAELVERETELAKRAAELARTAAELERAKASAPRPVPRVARSSAPEDSWAYFWAHSDWSAKVAVIVGYALLAGMGLTLAGAVVYVVLDAFI